MAKSAALFDSPHLKSAKGVDFGRGFHVSFSRPMCEHTFRVYSHKADFMQILRITEQYNKIHTTGHFLCVNFPQHVDEILKIL